MRRGERDWNAAHKPTDVWQAGNGARVTGKPFWLGGVAAMLALTATANLTPAAGEEPRGDFSPPATSMVLSRTLVRDLPDGKTITTRREYEVRFTRMGAGFRVDGALIDVAVDAPPSLAALAEIERRRPDAGLFPILLDASGIIIGNGEQVPGTAVGQAATLVSERIGASGLSALDMLQAQAFVARLRGNAARGNWPNDVFRPAPGRRSEQRSLSLPGGGAGEVTIEIEGQGPGPAGQVAAVDRIVTTDLGGDKRITREHWRISRAPATSER